MSPPASHDLNPARADDRGGAFNRLHEPHVAPLFQGGVPETHCSDTTAFADWTIRKSIARVEQLVYLPA